MHNIPNLSATQKVVELGDLEGSVELEDLAAYDRGKGNYHIRICTKTESVGTDWHEHTDTIGESVGGDIGDRVGPFVGTGGVGDETGDKEGATVVGADVN